MLVGVVGKPNVGKSTFFQALTMAPAQRANYPFTTIEPNRGVGHVEIECVDKDFNTLCNPRYGMCVHSRRFVPVELIDVAGLVPGAHEGKGLGNKFLDDLRQADALIHVVDASGSANENGETVAMGSYDPVKDVKFLEEELNYWILGILDKNWNKLSRFEASTTKTKVAILVEQMSGLGIKHEHIDESLRRLNLKEKKMVDWTPEELMKFAIEIRKTSKPIIIAANKCDLPTAENNVKRLREAYPEYIIVATSAETELALKEANKKEYIKYIPGDNHIEIVKELDEKQVKAIEFMELNILKKYEGTGVQKCINAAVFDLLKYIAVFPGGVNKLADSEGNVLPDVWLFPPNSTALDFAARIHKDMAEKFIKAINVKTKMPLGADYKLKHRDVLEIMFGR